MHWGVTGSANIAPVCGELPVEESSVWGCISRGRDMCILVYHSEGSALANAFRNACNCPPTSVTDNGEEWLRAQILDPNARIHYLCYCEQVSKPFCASGVSSVIIPALSSFRFSCMSEK
jgi:hypothetical protein